MQRYVKSLISILNLELYLLLHNYVEKSTLSRFSPIECRKHQCEIGGILYFILVLHTSKGRQTFPHIIKWIVPISYLSVFMIANLKICSEYCFDSKKSEKTWQFAALWKKDIFSRSVQIPSKTVDRCNYLGPNFLFLVVVLVRKYIEI